MPYCTSQDIQLRIPASFVAALANDAGGGEYDPDTVSRAITDADSMIDGYLRSRYQVPFASTPKIVQRLSVDLTVYYLYQRKHDFEMPDPVRFRYTDAIRTLESIAAGKMHIEDVPPSEAEVPTTTMSNKTKADRLFGRSVIDQW
jgi:phage gp36-like protein